MNTRVAVMLERYGPPIIGGIVILLVWEFVPAIFNVSKLLLPAPSSVIRSLWLIYDRGLLVENFLVTLVEALLGFAIGSVTAIFFAFAVTRSLIIERPLMPYLVGLQPLPKLAPAPLSVYWAGFGF